MRIIANESFQTPSSLSHYDKCFTLQTSYCHGYKFLQQHMILHLLIDLQYYVNCLIFFCELIGNPHEAFRRLKQELCSHGRKKKFLVAE